jgi:O-antigen/teichoic acid export membrane protein
VVARSRIHESPRSLPYLVVSRAVDQGSLALASLVLARLVGPAAFAPIAVLLVINSLAIQVSDCGLGFAVMRSRPGEQLALASLRRLRALSLAVVLIGSIVGLAVRGDVGIIIGCGSWIWALSAEAYVRKSSAIRFGAGKAVARAEIAGALCLLMVIAAVWGFDLGVGWFALGLVVKHAVEIVLVQGWRVAFSESGGLARSGAEWLGQVLSYAVANVDYLVVGVLLTPAELSTYVVAFRMGSALPALVGGPITNTAFVELADAPGEHRALVRARVLRRARWAGLVGTVGVLVMAPILPILLGPAWSGTGWLVAILAPAIPFRMLLGTAVANAITLGGARLVMVWELCRLVAVGVAAMLGGMFGLIPATALVSATTVVSLTAVHQLSGRLAGVRAMRREWSAACVALVAVAVLGLMAASASG